jgi:GalNAc-alpha-(1->4)-GalNAc-alpha-(1->3)-diNAcBac-PP-undecaprenol alpha-1,4-N-acetyl-D-galactosaminyltransferase
LYPRARGIIAQTKRAQQYYEQKRQLKNVRVIPNPVPDIHHPAGEKKNVILNVGRFVPSKNQALLLDIFTGLAQDGWELWFVGDGPELGFCKGKAAMKGDQNHIRFLGSRKDLKEIYNSAAIFAFTSDSEGFPNSLAEAMSAGCACISFDCNAGPSDLIEDGKSGFLIPEGDLDTYRTRLANLMGDKQLRTRFGLESLDSIKKYADAKITRAYLDFLTE